MSDALFGKAAVLLDYITPQQLTEALQHKEQFAKVQLDMDLAQILVNKNYIAENLIDEVKSYASKLPQTIQKVSSPGQNIPQKYQKKLGRYFIISNLGKGAMGEVFKAYDPHLDRIIALKVLTSLENENNVERFQREARTMAQLTHPNIVAVYDIANEDKQYFFAMDLIEGQTLDQLLQNNTLDFNDVVTIVLQIAVAVEYAHSHGVIHRDLKPANILLTHELEPKVTDFGLAKVAHEDQKLSQKGMIIGTLQYMPPEQAEGNLRLIDARSDIYSLGAILYEMITNFPPFSAPTFNQLVKKITKEDPILPRGIRSDVPKELEAICLKALNKRRENRYQNVKEFIWDIKCFQQGNSIQASAVHLQKVLLHKFRRHRKLSLAFASIITLLLTISFFLSRNEYQEYLENTLQKITIAEQGTVTVQSLKSKHDFSKNLTTTAKLDLEEALLRSITLHTLVDQALSIDRHNEYLKNKKQFIAMQLLELALLLPDLFLAKMFTKHFDNSDDIYQKYIAQTLAQEKKQAKSKLKKIFSHCLQQHKITDEALTIYANEISSLPYTATVSILLAKVRSSNKREAKLAIRCLGMLNSEEVATKLQRDLHFFLKKDHELALETIDTLIKLRKKIEILNPKSLLKYKKSTIKEHLSRKINWVTWLEETPDTEKLGQSYVALGQFELAKVLLEKKHSSLQSKISLAKTYIELRELDKAKTLISALPKNDGLYNFQAQILLYEKKWNTLIDDNSNIFKDDTQKNYYIGAAYAQKESIRAVTTFPVLTRKNQTIDFLVNKGIFYRKKGEYEESLKALFSANSVAKNSPNIYIQIAITLLKQGDVNTALWYLNKADLRAPENSDVLIWKAEAHFSIKNWAKCIFLCTKYLSNNTHSEKAHLLIAESYLFLSKNNVAESQKIKQLAIHHFDKVLNVNKKYARGYFLRAGLYSDLQLYKKALKDILRAKSQTKNRTLLKKLKLLYGQIKEKQRVE
ncbi:protein kinase [Candidatus Uabimicrobium sp. HlEnr_7]|uniref:protein kinase domain-containing protein n=1 Tax=Candidatus Uabimicrobium helgolandensis TaxID=3095367 RepID=UPI003556182C